MTDEKCWKDIKLIKWDKWNELGGFNTEKYLRAWISTKGDSGGFYISSKLAEELREKIGDKKFAEIYYGENEEGTIVIVFEFNDKRGYSVPPLYRGSIMARSLVEHLNIKGQITNDYILDNNKLIAFFRKGALVNRVVFEDSNTKGDVVFVEKIDVADYIGDCPKLYRIGIATTCEAIVLKTCTNFAVLIWDHCSDGLFAKSYKDIKEFEDEFYGKICTVILHPYKNCIVLTDKFTDIVKDLVENNGRNIFGSWRNDEDARTDR